MAFSRSRVWRCPACGHQVPLRHHTCHCGLARPVAPPSAGPRPAASSRSRGALAGLLLAALVGSGVSFYYRWPQRWYGGGGRPAVTPTPPAYPSLPETGPDEPLPVRASPPGTGDGSSVPVPAPGTAGVVDTTPPRDTPVHARQAETRQTTASRYAGIEPVEEPGPLALAERRAVKELSPRVVALADLADAVDARLRSYVRACRRESQSALPVPRPSTRRDWPVAFLLDPAMATTARAREVGSDPSGCAAMWTNVRGDADEVAAALEELNRFCRLKGVLPGHLRAALAEYRLEGWERYPPPRP